MCVGMVQLVAMDMVFPTGSAKIGRDGCRGGGRHTYTYKRLNHCNSLADSFFSFVEKLCILSMLMTAHLVCCVI